MAIPSELDKMQSDFFKDYAHEFDLSHAVGCGAYIEAFVRHAQSNGYPKVGHLRKYGGQTQYNGHAVDAFLYRQAASVTNPLYQAVDIIANAESPNARPAFQVDEPRYMDKDWMEKPAGSSEPSKMVPWVNYDEGGFQKLKKTLAHDYARRPQGADFDVSVWAARVFHSTYMGPDGTPLGMDSAMRKHKPEWCGALGVPVDNYYGE